MRKTALSQRHDICFRTARGTKALVILKHLDRRPMGVLCGIGKVVEQTIAFWPTEKPDPRSLENGRYVRRFSPATFGPFAKFASSTNDALNQYAVGK